MHWNIWGRASIIQAPCCFVTDVLAILACMKWLTIRDRASMYKILQLWQSKSEFPPSYHIRLLK